jgi:hypothetical protein
MPKLYVCVLSVNLRDLCVSVIGYHGETKGIREAQSSSITALKKSRNTAKKFFRLT